MKKKLLGFIETNPKILFHYVPLVGIVFLAYYSSVWLNLMELVNTQPLLGWTSLFLLYYIFLLVGDNLIHKLIGEY